MTPTSSRAYGRACITCRTRKRKCHPSREADNVCEFCDTNDIPCELYSKRHRRDTRDTSSASGSTPTEQRRASTSTGSPLRSPLNDGHSYSSVNALRPDTSVIPMMDDNWLHSSASDDFIPHSRTANDLGEATMSSGIVNDIAPSPMAVGHGSTYQSAMRDLVTRVCGGTHENEPDEELLSLYFAWQEPQHMPVDEDLFRRDMTARPHGPYYSPLLLQAIHAQASRHLLSRDNGWAYADRASALLVASLSDPPSITTVQALLIMAGRELALGVSSAGWLKSGMAFRMIEEMDLERDAYTDLTNGLAGVSEQVYMRQRLFWSAYSWDKFFALTLGRQPAMLSSVAKIRVPTLPLPKDRFWQPYAIDIVYTPQLSHSAEMFHALCLLNVELESIIRQLYDYRCRVDRASESIVIGGLRDNLLAWRSRVSPHVLLDTSYLPLICPPPHILTLNILYRTAWILLLRRFTNPGQPNTEARRACLARSAEIHQLFQLHDVTFQLRNLTYITAYSAYVSATVDVSEAIFNHSGLSAEASARLELTLRVLTKAAYHTPGIQRSIHHLKQRLSQPLRSVSEAPSGATTPTTAHPTGESIRAASASFGRQRSDIDRTPQLNTFGVLPLGAGFEELFAALLPEYVAEPMVSGESGSTADLSMMPDDWLAAFEL